MKGPHPLQRILATDATLPWLAALLGMLVAGWMIFQSHGIINRDGLLYVEIAHQFSLGHWQQGLALYNWPLYPLLIAVVHKLSGFGLLTSAQIITLLSFALTSSGMVMLTRELGANRNVMIATALLLFCSTPLIDNYMAMVLRDHAFLAAHVWSLVFFLRFYRRESWCHAATWGITAALAVLFRIEGIVYLGLLPLVLLTRPQHAWRFNLIALFKANVLLIAITAVLVTALLLHPGFDMHKLGRLTDPLTVGQQFMHQLSQGLSAKANIYADQVLGKFLDDFATSGLLLTLAFAVLLRAATAAGWLQLALALLGYRQRNHHAFPQHPRVIHWLLILSLITAAVIILSVFVMTKRYLLPVAMIVLLYGAGGMARLYEDWRQASHIGRKSWLFPIAVVALVLQLIAILKPGSDQERFEMDAARWVVQHTAPDSRIYYDDGRLDYYVSGNSVSREVAEWKDIEKLFSNHRAADFDYMLVHVPKKNPEREQFLTRELGAAPVASFQNSRGKRVLIYRVTPQRTPAH